MADRINISGSSNVVRRAPTTPMARDGAAPSIGTDTLSKSATTAPTPGGLSSQDQQALGSLSTGVRQIVLSYGISDGQPDATKQDQIKQNLSSEIHQLVPGGVYLIADKGTSWSIQDLTNLYNVISSMSPGDRAQLSGVSFIRSQDAQSVAGASAAVKREAGSDAAAFLGQFGAGGESTAADVQSESPVSRIMHGIGGFFVHAIEKIDDVFGIHLISDKTAAEYDGKPQRTVILTDTGSNLMISSHVWAHEIGHQMELSDGRWNPDKIAEFSSLSGWTQPVGKTDETFDGINPETGARMEFASGVKAARTDNFVSTYAKTNPEEDFAESYAAYLQDPATLMKRAPDKFLFINATSKKYTAAQVAQYAKDAGVGLSQVATDLVVNSSLHQKTLDDIVSVNGVTVDPRSVAAEAASARSAPSPLMQAWGSIVASYGRDPKGTAAELQGDPQQLVGSAAWGKLSDSDRQMLQDPTFARSMIASLSRGAASARSGADATRLAEQQAATNAALHSLLEDAAFRHALVANPTQALADPAFKNLPSDAVAALTNPANATALKTLCSTIDKLQSQADGGNWDSYTANVDKVSSQLTPENFKSFTEGLNDPKHPDTAAKVIENALKTGNAIFPGDGSGQPGA